jgi:tetratricopeptide (TPR) repeat protein
MAWCLVFLLWAGSGIGWAVGNDRFVQIAKGAFDSARKEHSQNPEDPRLAWTFGRACFELAEFATNHVERAAIAELGIAACRAAVALSSNCAPAHYYLGLNFGQLARTKGLGALKLITHIEREFLAATALDPQLEYAGPHRSVGLLYLDAPVIASVGSRSKAKHHLQRAVDLAPTYPDNRLCLLEAYLKWGDRAAARRELKALQEIWSKARAEFTGDKWGPDWPDWERRLEAAQHKLGTDRKP